MNPVALLLATLVAFGVASGIGAPARAALLADSVTIHDAAVAASDIAPGERVFPATEAWALAGPRGAPGWAGHIYTLHDFANDPDRADPADTPTAATAAPPTQPIAWALLTGALILTGTAMRRRRGAGASSTGALVIS